MSTSGDAGAGSYVAPAPFDLAAFGPVPFDPALPHRCSPRVALRPEPFGALVYHFGTRRLSFLKTPELVRVVSGLADHPDVHAALGAAGVAEVQRPAYLRALAGLAENGTIERRAADELGTTEERS